MENKEKIANKFDMWTYTQKVVDPMNLKADDISLIDIGVSLSRQVRYNGHTTTNDHYSVARHSLILADMVYDSTGSKDMEAVAFAHDFSEAYMGDIIRPIRSLCPALKKLEAELTESIFTRLKIKSKRIPTIVRDLDNLLLNLEMSHFFPKLYKGDDIDELTHLKWHSFDGKDDYEEFVNRAIELFDLTDEECQALVKSAEDIAQLKYYAIRNPEKPREWMRSYKERRLFGYKIEWAKYNRPVIFDNFDEAAETAEKLGISEDEILKLDSSYIARIKQQDRSKI
ncbi:MAG: hypothetical protein HAW67_00615 [Endozoicomonadaceae bacterium]|nr:hypothetical protein [Endozoicomonadaceae bacterium]